MTTIEILKAARARMPRHTLDYLFQILPLETVYRDLGYASVSGMLSEQSDAEVLQRFDEAIARLEQAKAVPA